MTFEELQAVNKEISTIPMEKKNKKTGETTRTEYSPVNQRILAFRKLFPMGTIETELISNEGGMCVIKATARIGETVLGTGHSYEKEGSNFINTTSFLENCESSAIGRCLGACGIGIDNSVASAEEVQNALVNQEQHSDECGNEIMDTVIKGGDIWPAAKIIGYSLRRFHRVLCPDCQKKKMKEDA